MLVFQKSIDADFEFKISFNKLFGHH